MLVRLHHPQTGYLLSHTTMSCINGSSVSGLFALLQPGNSTSERTGLRLIGGLGCALGTLNPDVALK